MFCFFGTKYPRRLTLNFELLESEVLTKPSAVVYVYIELLYIVMVVGYNFLFLSKYTHWLSPSNPSKCIIDVETQKISVIYRDYKKSIYKDPCHEPAIFGIPAGFWFTLLTFQKKNLLESLCEVGKQHPPLPWSKLRRCYRSDERWYHDGRFTLRAIAADVECAPLLRIFWRWGLIETFWEEVLWPKFYTSGSSPTKLVRCELEWFWLGFRSNQ